MGKTKSKMLVYKAARFNSNQSTGGPALQDMVTEALTRDVAQERFQIDKLEQTTSLINHFETSNGMLFGDFCSFTAGNHQSVVTINKTAKELPISFLAPQGANDEFVESMLIFGIRDQHVILAQSQALRAQQLEMYLNWLLREKYQIIAPEDVLHLADPLPVKKSKNIKRVKSLLLSSSIDLHHPQEVEDHQRHTIKLQGRAWAALKALIGEAIDLPTEIKPDETIEKRMLDIELSVKIRSRQKDDKVTLLDTIANNLRHVDDEVDYRIDTSSGGTITKNDFKPSRRYNIEYEGGTFNPRDLYPRMLEWLTILASERDITRQR